MTVPELVAELEHAGAQLWEEAGQLRFRAPTGVMTELRRQALRESKQAVVEHLRQRPAGPLVVARPADRHEPFPLTDVQGAYLLGRSDAFNYGGTACHGYGELAVPDLEPSRVKDSWSTLVDRHGMLRAVIDERGHQRVLSEVPDYVVPVVDLLGAEPAQVATVIEGLREEMGHRRYPPDRWPLFDLRLSRTAEGTRLHLSIDFLIADLVSTQRLFEELHQLCVQPDKPLPALDISYRDYVLAERELLAGPAYERDKDYWLRRLDELPDRPDLPVVDRASSVVQYSGPVRFRRRQLTLAPADWAELRKRAGRHGVTPSVAVLTAYAEVIGRWSRHQRFTLNLTLQNRQPLHPQVGLLVGDFTSVGLLAVDQEPGQPFHERATALQGELWDNLDHRLFSGVRVAREAARRHGSGAGLFPIVFTSAIGVDGGSGSRLGDLGYGITQTPQVWIDCQALESQDALVVNWDVREGVFPDGLVDDMFAAFDALLHSVATDGAYWGRSDVVALPAAQLALRSRVNDTRGPQSGALLHEGLVSVALGAPDRPALLDGDRVLSYRELLGRALAVSAALDAAGARCGDIVAVVMEKGWGQVVAVVGILLSGAAYLPIDTGQPPVRRNQILADAEVGIAVVATTPDDQWPARVVAVDVDQPAVLLPSTPPPRRAEPDALAYVIYTSGSTGVPKGVMISHRGAVNTIEDINRRYEVGPADRVLGLAGLGFDLSVYDIFGVLAAGGVLVLPDPARCADPSHWAELVAAHGVTLWNSVPAQLQMLADYLNTADELPASRLVSLRLAMMSGDWIPTSLPDRIRQALPTLRLVSLGGATEVSIWSIGYPIDEVPPDWPSIPYGFPLTNQTFHVLDAAMRPCADWVAGELYIGGVGVALGYLGDESKTAERFIRDPTTGGRLYRTGDFGRYHPDGAIELLGRQDRQVKIRGHRIELAEVEAALAAYPGVGAAAALAEGETPLERRLVAFVETVRHAAPRPLPGQLARLIHDAGVRACREAVSDIDPVRRAAYEARLDEVALLSMRAALYQFGLPVDEAVAGLPFEELAAAVAPRYHRVLRRWLRAMCDHGLVRWDQEASTYRGVLGDRTVPTGAEPLDAAWQQVAQLADGVENVGLVEYFHAAAQQLPALLAGDADPLQLLFPEGRAEVADNLYQLTSTAKAANAALAAVAAQLATGHPAGESLRVLEVGAGTGGTSAAVLAALADIDVEDVEYVCSDLSQFFVAEARRRLADYPGTRFALFDLDEDARAQGFEPNSFDLVLTADTLHATRDIEGALGRLRQLLRPGGWLVCSEMTRDHYAVMTSLELLVRVDETTGDFTDERAGNDVTFLSCDAWRDLLSRTGADPVVSMPEDDPVVTPSGMRVFVARFKGDRLPVTPARLTEHLRGLLPEHMLPAHVQVLDALPLTGNGKVDHTRLRSWLPRRGHELVTDDAPRPATELGRRLAAVWAEVLGAGAIGSDQRFIDLGGDSLLAARLAGRLRDEIPEAQAMFFDDLLRQILQSPTVTELGALLVQASEDTAAVVLFGDGASPLVRLGGVGTGPTWVLLPGDSGDLRAYGAAATELASRGPVVGLVVTDVDTYLGYAADTLIDWSADTYAQALLDQACMSVYLVGDGAGATTAVEVARRLGEAGAAVHGLTLILPGLAGEGGNEAVRRHAREGARRHVFEPYAGDLTILWQADGSTRRRDVVAEWSRACIGDVEVVDVPELGALDLAAVLCAVADQDRPS